MKRLWSSAWLLLALTNLFWAGNFVIGRAVAGSVPPVTLAWCRWTAACLVALPLAWPHLKRDGRVLLAHWPIMLVLAASGIASFNAMTYIGLQYTTATNALLLQSAMPVVILLWVYLMFGERPSPFQALGVAVSLAGVAVIAARGSPALLMRLSLNAGDLWVIIAVAIYAFYSAILRKRPKVHPLSFLAAAMAIGSFMLLPFFLWEAGQGARIEGGWPSWAAVGYTAVLPSFVAYLFFNRGVELIGAARAGQSLHLMPAFGTALAAVALGERPQLYHLAGVALIGAGLLLASRRGSWAGAGKAGGMAPARPSPVEGEG